MDACHPTIRAALDAEARRFEREERAMAEARAAEAQRHIEHRALARQMREERHNPAMGYV
ncbi:hypothetical protein [Paracidovorax cattleyae]|uniref:Uncharacterized protein n=1 Tax=Paracidovorax cattleyae TaxID=80868 RepID=A0A1H0RG64_9BURK|nr:hypothetical protein [Paracidovorax cattleyae]SDP28179.1 hypothetical protein SAMN04489708_11038 [Paracidovorax cattleyae]